MPEEKKSKRDLVNDQIAELEKELSTTKYNKKTQHHIGLVKAKLASLKDRQEQRAKGGKRGEGYAVRKSGDGTAILLGFPSVGKSTLLNYLTNADSPVGAYDFTTLDVIPGLMEYNFAKIQILDVPGIVTGAASGRGRGKEVLAVLRNADLVIIVVDVHYPEHHKVILKEVYDSHLRINQIKPDVKIKKTGKGGILAGATVKLTHLTEELITGVMREFGIANAEVLIRDDITVEQLIDAIEKNKIYVPAITIVTKVDTAEKVQIDKVKKLVKPDLLVSADADLNMDKLKDLIFDRMNFMRLYLKEVNKKPDMDEPLIVFKGSTIGDVCNKLHRDFITKFKFARVWGTSAKFPGQKFLKLHKVLEDGDILEVHLR